MVLYPNKLPESERVCSGICKYQIKNILNALVVKAFRIFFIPKFSLLSPLPFQ